MVVKLRKYLPKLKPSILILILLLITYEIVYLRVMNKTVISIKSRIKQRMFYAIAWNVNVTPFHILTDTGQKEFVKNKCEFTNCYVTHNRSFFKDIRKFDVVLFSGLWLGFLNDLPKKRSQKQKYIYVNVEPAANAESYIIYHKYDNFFNWTWTYRLDSDIVWRYFVIYDLNGVEIGPRKGIEWLKHYEPTKEVIKDKLRKKTKAAAWIVSNCQTVSRREIYIQQLQTELRKYNLFVDVFGNCGIKCGNNTICHDIVEKEYYFYLAFENSYDEDYVSEKVLNAYLHFAIPIVRGGANYSRFLPPSTYIDATKMKVSTLARTMLKIISNFSLHQEYFRWTNHYTFKYTLVTELCNLCTALNVKKLNEKKVYKDFVNWWKGYPKSRIGFSNLLKYDKKFRQSVYATLKPKLLAKFLSELYKHINKTHTKI